MLGKMSLNNSMKRYNRKYTNHAFSMRFASCWVQNFDKMIVLLLKIIKNPIEINKKREICNGFGKI